ncbi:MAG: protein tyrosine phosphatase family protein [Acidimicrobiales bacterium]
MSIEASTNFHRIDDRLTTSGAVPLEALAGLAAAGYHAVIDLLPHESDWATPGEADVVRGQGVDYVYIPVDFAAPSRADLDAFTSAMDAHEGRTVHVHCAANYRVSAFYALYALRKGVWSAEDADRHVRSIWNPEDYPPWAEFIAAERRRIAPAG